MAVSPSPLRRFADASTASRFSGSLAKRSRFPASHRWAPFCQASDRATTWSTSTLPSPRRKAMRLPVYGSAAITPLATLQRSPSLRRTPVASRTSMSSRVPQPLPSVSAQARPNFSRS